MPYTNELPKKGSSLLTLQTSLMIICDKCNWRVVPTCIMLAQLPHSPALWSHQKRSHDCHVAHFRQIAIVCCLTIYHPMCVNENCSDHWTIGLLHNHWSLIEEGWLGWDRVAVTLLLFSQCDHYIKSQVLKCTHSRANLHLFWFGFGALSKSPCV